MKTLRAFSFLLLFVSMTALLTSCDEEMTVDVPGPDIEFHFTYSDLDLHDVFFGYGLVAESDTLYGKDVRDFLSNSGQQYDSVISSATIKNAILTMNQEHNFSGIDSLQLRYRIAGTSTELVLATAYYSASSPDTLRFTDLKVSKAAAFELISKDVIASLYAKVNPASSNNIFHEGVEFTFKAKTSLAVKMSALANGFSL